MIRWRKRDVSIPMGAGVVKPDGWSRLEGNERTGRMSMSGSTSCGTELAPPIPVSALCSLSLSLSLSPVAPAVSNRGPV
eukprot:7089968-Pyramimonas_sp.AAC.1